MDHSALAAVQISALAGPPATVDPASIDPECKVYHTPCHK